MHKETSSRVSTIAAHILNHAPIEPADSILADRFNTLLIDAKALAGSCMSQDETPGQAKPSNGIHPAPAEFTDAQIASDPILHFFHYAHLPAKLQETSKAFFNLAAHVVNTVPRSPERTVALRKLLEGKDAAVRANLPAPALGQKQLPLASQQSRAAGAPIGEPVEIGGHDEDRDGPIPFNS
jgi:hypothetical protein